MYAPIYNNKKHAIGVVFTSEGLDNVEAEPKKHQLSLHLYTTNSAQIATQLECNKFQVAYIDGESLLLQNSKQALKHNVVISTQKEVQKNKKEHLRCIASSVCHVFILTRSFFTQTKLLRELLGALADEMIEGKTVLLFNCEDVSNEYETLINKKPFIRDAFVHMQHVETIQDVIYLLSKKFCCSE